MVHGKSREVIDCYLRYCEALFHRFGKKVRYWITFNEINMLMHLPFMGAGIRLEEDENPMECKIQAAHHGTCCFCTGCENGA